MLGKFNLAIHFYIFFAVETLRLVRHHQTLGLFPCCCSARPAVFSSCLFLRCFSIRMWNACSNGFRSVDWPDHLISTKPWVVRLVEVCLVIILLHCEALSQWFMKDLVKQMIVLYTFAFVTSCKRTYLYCEGVTLVGLALMVSIVSALIEYWAYWLSTATVFVAKKTFLLLQPFPKFVKLLVLVELQTQDSSINPLPV